MWLQYLKRRNIHIYTFKSTWPLFRNYAQGVLVVQCGLIYFSFTQCMFYRFHKHSLSAIFINKCMTIKETQLEFSISIMQKNSILNRNFDFTSLKIKISHHSVDSYFLVVLWYFFTSEMSEKIHNLTFQVKISVQNAIFPNEMEK